MYSLRPRLDSVLLRWTCVQGQAGNLRVTNSLPDADEVLVFAVDLVGAEVRVARRLSLGHGEASGDPACSRDIRAPAHAVGREVGLADGAAGRAVIVAALGPALRDC